MDLVFKAQLLQGKGFHCPCCDRYAQLYKRQLHATVVRQLIKLYNLGGEVNFIHASNLVPENQSGSGDLTKAKYWGLIYEEVNNNPKIKTSGYWKLTKEGVDFILGAAPIAKHIFVFDDQVVSKSADLIFIKDCFEESFNYQQLMDGAYG